MPKPAGMGTPQHRASRMSGHSLWTTLVALTLAVVLLLAVQVAGEAAAGAPQSAAPATTSTSVLGASDRTALLDGRDRPRPETAPRMPARRPEAPAPLTPPAPPAPAAPAAPVAPVAPAQAPAPAPAPPVPAAAPAPSGTCSGDGWQSRRGAAALASLRAGAERTGFRVEFAPAREGYMGLTYLQERRIEVFVRSCERQSDELLRHVMAHELGHAYDTTHMTAQSRAAWQAARGIPASTPWYGCSGCTDFATPAGDFAEVYAQWARGASSNRSELAGAPGPGALAALAAQFFGA